MGKKRIIKKAADGSEAPAQGLASQIRKKRGLTNAIVHIFSTYNNTLITLTDERGNVVLSASCGKSGFKGSKKGTPYAATKAATLLADQARELGVTDIEIRVKGVGAGRESAMRLFGQKGFSIQSIRDVTPVPHGYIRAPKPRRV